MVNADFLMNIPIQGNWTFVEVLLEQPADTGDERIWNGRPYRRFSSGYTSSPSRVESHSWVLGGSIQIGECMNRRVRFAVAGLPK